MDPLAPEAAARRHPAGWLALLALGAGLHGCTKGSGTQPGALRPLRAEFAGCESVWRGPVCTPPESRRLRLWIEAIPGAGSGGITVDGRVPARPPVPVEGGLGFDVEAAPGARQIVVEVRHPGATQAWRLRLADSRQPAWYAAAWKLAAAGDVAAARGKVAPWLSSPSPSERGLALQVAARADLATGEEARAEDEMRRAIAAHRESGALSWEVEAATALAQRLIERRDFAAARAVLDAFPDPAGHADSAFQLAYTSGVLATEVGDVRAGLGQLRAAMEHAARGGMTRKRVLAGEVLARELQRVGQAAAAEALFARLDGAAAELPACRRAELRNNEAWARLLAREAGAAAEDPKPLLAEVLKTFEEECAIFPRRDEERVNVRVNLALAELQDGAPDLARRWLAEARELQPEPGGDLLLWWADLDARIDLAAGDGRRALGAYRDLADRAREVLAPEAEWRAVYGEARARAALGDVTGALGAYQRAEELLARESLLVPMHLGRDTFLGQREEATRRHLDLLLRAGRPAAALALARRARSRFLRTLEAAVRLANLPPADRQEWERTVAAYGAQREELDRSAAEHWRLAGGELARAADQHARRSRELRNEIDALLARCGMPGTAGDAAPLPPAPGEVLLAYYPLPTGWVGFAADATGVTALRLGRLDADLDRPAALAARVLAPFATAIRKARRVRVLADGPLRRVAFHTLPFDGDALVATTAVVYALDLASAPAAAPGPAQVLVVGDPAGDLPGARAEAQEVASALGGGRRARPVRALLGRQAMGPAVRPLLAASGLFHYAGHAVFAGWDSYLPLAAEGRLTVDDVLALPRSPAWVVLSGCDTGASSAESTVESIGLAHAFLAAGAQAVIAAVRPVPDREASALMQAFYAELPQSPSADEALRRAQLALRARRQGAAWESFRAFVP